MLTYNHEDYIAESIKSVVSQSYDNWELIIVDMLQQISCQQSINDVLKNY